MKTALITTLFNENKNLLRWWQSIIGQTVRPDEIMVVDGGSTDGTWERLQELARESPVPVKLKQERCNIARGRNLAIAMTDAEVIASTDAGSYPRPDWFAEITRPLLNDPAVDAVGGRSVNLVENDFQRLVVSFQAPPIEHSRPEKVYPSSRNIAFRRKAWSDVGGYPEWLTLTAEDALFNHALHKVGCRFHYNRDAVVAWPIRENAPSHFKMLYSYGYGAAEARLYAGHFWFNILISLCPWLLLLSRHRTRGVWFRYRNHFSGATGWIAGWLRGHRAPAGWKRFEGVLLSPEAQQCMASGRRSAAR